MKPNTLAFLAMAIILTLSACAPPTPAPVNETGGYQPVTVDDVAVEVGVGSPIPVHVNVSGNLPDTCSQVEYGEIMQDGSNFIIRLSATPSAAEGCIQDSLPFRMSIPLNVIGLPAGDYSVEVNGTKANFSLHFGSSASYLLTVYSAFYKDDIEVNNVTVENGQGSPIPVHAIVSLNLPDSCAQLGEVRLHRDGTTFFVRLISYVIEGDDCRADSIPFRLDVPLNIVNLTEGPYTVNVNGATASFDIPLKQFSLLNLLPRRIL